MWGRHPEQLSAPCEAYALREMTASLTDQPPRTLRTHDAAEPFRTTYGQGNVPCYARKHGILRVQLGIGSWEASGSNRYGPCDVRQDIYASLEGLLRETDLYECAIRGCLRPVPISEPIDG